MYSEKHITKKKKYGIYETMVKSTLLYGSETWKITQRNKKKLEAVEMKAFKRMMGISKRDRRRNEEVRTQVGIEDTIIKDIEEKQLMWYGHVQRMSDH